MNWFWFALIALICWSGSDLFSKIGCCGECPYYSWKKHKCSKGATAEVDYRIPFYDDCPLEWEEIEREEGENV